MRLLKNLFTYSFFLILIILAFTYRSSLLQFYNWGMSQSGGITQLTDSISKVLSFFQ